MAELIGSEPRPGRSAHNGTTQPRLSADLAGCNVPKSQPVELLGATFAPLTMLPLLLDPSK